MKGTKMRKLLGLALAIAIGGCAQVSQDEFVRQYGQAGRSDGIFQNKVTNGLEAFVNGFRMKAVDGKTFQEDFTEYGDGDEAGCIQNDWTICSGTSGEINLLTMPSGNRFAEIILGGDNTGADMDAGSLDLAGDAAANEGIEIMWGGAYGSGGAPFVIGRDPAFYTCATITAADWSGAAEMKVGFHRLEDTNAFDNYLDAATIGVMAGAATHGDVMIETIDDNAGTTTTDTTDNIEDATALKHCVYVSAAGVVTYTLNGLEPLTTAAFTWDDADPVVPFLYLLQHADLTAEVDLTDWQVGYGAAPF
jgi:hypothetical protein